MLFVRNVDLHFFSFQEICYYAIRDGRLLPGFYSNKNIPRLLHFQKKM